MQKLGQEPGWTKRQRAVIWKHFGSVAESPTTSGRFSDFGKMSAISMKGAVSINKNKHHMHFEMTPEQYELLHTNAKACGLSKRAYLIRLIEGEPIKARNAPEIRALRMGYEIKYGNRLGFRLYGQEHFIYPERKNSQYSEDGIRNFITGNLQEITTGRKPVVIYREPYRP